MLLKQYQDFKLGQNWVKFWSELGQILVGFSGGKIWHVDLARFILVINYES